MKRAPCRLLLTLLLSAGALACHHDESDDLAKPAPTTERTQPLEEQLSESPVAPAPSPTQGGLHNPLARDIAAAHDAADAASNSEDKRRAASQLERLLERIQSERSPLMGEVRDDVASRAARLHMEAGAPVEAQRIASRALRKSDAPTIGRANLLVVLADAEEALGNPDLARKHLLEALSVNQQLLDRELENP